MLRKNFDYKQTNITATTLHFIVFDTDTINVPFTAVKHTVYTHIKHRKYTACSYNIF